MVPQQVTCECDGRIEPARDDEQPMACGHVQTMCVGEVKRERVPAASTFDLLRVRTPSGGQDGGTME